MLFRSVVGNKAELESLDGVPVKLYNDNDFIMPVAMFVANPSALVVDEMGEQLLTVSKDYHTLSLWPTLCMMVLMTLLTFAVHRVYLKSKQSLTDITQKAKRTA